MTDERRSEINDLLEQVRDMQLRIDLLLIEEEKELEVIHDNECDEVTSAAIEDLECACDTLDEVIEYLKAATE